MWEQILDCIDKIRKMNSQSVMLKMGFLLLLQFVSVMFNTELTITVFKYVTVHFQQLTCLNKTAEPLPKRIHTYMHAFMHARTHARARAHTHAHTHTYVRIRT
jgi:hypothetical protein